MTSRLSPCNSEVHSALSFRAGLTPLAACSLNRRTARTRPHQRFYDIGRYYIPARFSVKVYNKFIPNLPSARQRLYNWDMIELNIPGWGNLAIEHLVMDVNGTLAVDGILLDGIAKRVGALRNRLTVHMLTANTHGGQAVIDQLLNLQAVRIQPGDEAGQKAAFVRQLGAERVAAIGQGANDAQMLKAAALGICVLSVEGLAVETLNSADLFMPDILSALDLFDKPLRLIASLRK